jgi:3,4-dihydroxy 2-butanone 4-phosphate synthase/GTP cyclohydrolase II
MSGTQSSGARGRDGGAFSDVPSVLEDMAAGKFVIVVDDENRENEGDLCMPAQFVTPEAVTFLLNQAKGFLCVAVAPAIAERLDLRPMVEDNTARFETPFTVSVDAREGISTGVSAQDRARTIQTIVSQDACPEDLARPGHVFPLAARPGGTLVRAGHTEAAVDLTRLAGLEPAALICEVVNPDGSMAKLPDLERMAEEFGFKICSIVDIIRYRHRSEYLIEKSVWVDLPTRWGEFTLHYYCSSVDPREHIAICRGDVGTRGSEPAQPIEEPVLVRVHDECFTGDVLGSLRCDCGQQLDRALQMIARAGRGVVLYMRQEGRGIGLEHKLRAYVLQNTGLDTVEANIRLGFPADKREYGVGAQILRHLGVLRMRLISNNPRKFKALRGYGLEIVDRVPIKIHPGKENMNYLRTKQEKMGHMLDLDTELEEEGGAEETGKAGGEDGAATAD